MDFHIKKLFNQLYDSEGKLDFGKMSFRKYNPSKDIIVKKFFQEDWEKIFSDLSEKDIKDLQNCANVEILLWVDTFSGLEKGMIYLEEKRNLPFTIEFHGGTWDHSPYLYRYIFISLLKLFKLLLSYNYDVATTCRENDTRIERLQSQFGFIEYERHNALILKKLNKDIFFQSKLQTLINP